MSNHEVRQARAAGILGVGEASAIAHRPTASAEVREVVLRLRQPQFAKLVEQARARGKTPAAWALDLFQAAYSARVAPTGDADLDTAVARIGSDDAGAIGAPAEIFGLSNEAEKISQTAQARELNVVRQALANETERAKALAARLVNAERELEIAKASLGGAERQRDEHMISLGAVEDRCGDLARQLEEAREKCDALHEAVAERDARLSALEARIAEATRLPAAAVAPAAEVAELTADQAKRARAYRAGGMSPAAIAAAMKVDVGAVRAALRSAA